MFLFLLILFIYPQSVSAKPPLGWDRYFECFSAIEKSPFLLKLLSPNQRNKFLLYDSKKKLLVRPDAQNIGWGKHNRMAVYSSKGVFDCRFKGKKSVKRTEPSVLVGDGFLIELGFVKKTKSQKILGFSSGGFKNKYHCVRGGKAWKLPSEVRIYLATANKNLSQRLWPLERKPKLAKGSADHKSLQRIVESCRKIPKLNYRVLSLVGKISRKIHRSLDSLIDHYPGQLEQYDIERQNTEDLEVAP